MSTKAPGFVYILTNPSYNEGLVIVRLPYVARQYS